MGCPVALNTWSGPGHVQVLVQAASVQTGRYSHQDWTTRTRLQHQLMLEPKGSGGCREIPNLNQPQVGGFGCPSTMGSMHPRASRCGSTWQLEDSAARGAVGSEQGLHLSPTAWLGIWGTATTCVRVQGATGYQDPLLQNNPPNLLPATSWLNILHIYRNSGLTHTSPAGCSCRRGPGVSCPA